jgi:hypothetical protein
MDYQFISIMSIVKAMKVCLVNAVTLELEMKTVRKVAGVICTGKLCVNHNKGTY